MRKQGLVSCVPSWPKNREGTKERIAYWKPLGLKNIKEEGIWREIKARIERISFSGSYVVNRRGI